MFIGLSYATTRAEMLRSIMEGCAFAVLDNLRVAEATGVRVTEWLATGGAARSPVWNQIKADVTGRPLVVARRADGGEGGHGLGLFALAAEAVGLAGDAAETVERLLPRRTTFEPDARRHARYEASFEVYHDLSRAAGHIRPARGVAGGASVKAAVLEAERQLAYRDVADPMPGDGEVLLEVRASAVCGSDVHRYLRGHRTYPMIMGHEAAGIVSAIGPGVDESLRGRHAALIPLVPCHACAQCRAGRFSACATYSFIGSRRDGAFAQLVALPASNLLLVPDDLPFEAAALIEPSTVARHMLDLGHVRSGDTAVVFGAGSIGLMLVQWLRILGARLIVGLGPRRRESRGSPGRSARTSPWTPPTMTSPRRSCDSPVGARTSSWRQPVRRRRSARPSRSRARAARSSSAATSLSTRACP